MPLFTLTVRHGPIWFTTQTEASTAHAAAEHFFDAIYPAIRNDAFGDTAPDVRASDLVLFVPMDGLTNAWAATAGREGRYVELVCSRTSTED